MLPKRSRLTAEQFEEVMKKGRVSHSPLFIVRHMAITEAITSGVIAKKPIASRISAVGPVKVAKTAVLRNKIRRKIYIALTPLFPEIQSGFEIIVVAKVRIDELPVADIAAELKAIFAKAGLLK